MDPETKPEGSGSNQSQGPEIYILSGGVGTSGEQLVNTVLAQFPDNPVQIHTVGNIRHPDQVTRVLKQAQGSGGLIVHTMVDDDLKDQLVREAQEMGVETIDLMSPLIGWLAKKLDRKPLKEPGRYRMLHRAYFDRVAAINYTLGHDDGKDPDGWPEAEIILLGVSRSGKTPLSVYLAVLGWKVANYPLVPGLPVPEALFRLDPSRVFGLTIDPEQLLVYRRQRQAKLGVKESSSYTDLDTIREEQLEAKRIYRQGSYTIINMTDKTIEQGADEILRRRAGQPAPEI